MSELKCEVVRDLLPLYVEDLVSPETRGEIDAHLTGCEACRACLSRESAQVPVASQVHLKESAPLKRVYGRLILVIVGSPVWFSLALALGVTALSLYIALWAVIAALWCVPLSLACVTLASLVQWVWLAVHGIAGTGLFYVGAGLCCAGLAVLSGWGCWHLTRWTARCSRYCFRKLAAKWKERTA